MTQIEFGLLSWFQSLSLLSELKYLPMLLYFRLHSGILPEGCFTHGSLPLWANQPIHEWKYVECKTGQASP